MKVSVIISTYNAEEWLDKVLFGYMDQTYKEYEVIVADDGSRPATKQLIDDYKEKYSVPLRHIWHEDLGYRRQEILNIAILEANNEFIIMTDGDCIPRKDFVEVHVNNAQKGTFLSGGYCKLGMDLSKKITLNDIKNQNCFNINWLKKQEKLSLSNRLKIGSNPLISNVLDLISPTTPSFNNCNSSGFKKDMIAINGYDERMKYGGPDREFGERLENYGIKGKQIRHKAICLHLDHSRSYKTPESLKTNLEIRKEVKDKKIVWTPYGIIKSSNL